MRALTYIALLMLFTGCLTGNKVLRNPEMYGLMRITDLKDSTGVTATSDTIADILFYDWTEADTNMLQLFLECDSEGQVLLKQIADLTASKTKERIVYKYKLTDNTLELNTIVAELRRQLNIQREVNRHRMETKVVEHKVEVPTPYIPDILYYISLALLLVTNYITYRITKRIYKR